MEKKFKSITIKYKVKGKKQEETVKTKKQAHDLINFLYNYNDYVDIAIVWNY